MLSYIDKTIPKQPPEKEYGNKEYKRYLKNHPKNNQERFIEKRATQMLYRLIEGNGKALYLFGIDDDGEIVGMSKEELDSTIFFLEKIAKSISAKIKKFRIYTGGKGFVGTARIHLPIELLQKIMDSINLNSNKDM